MQDLKVNPSASFLFWQKWLLYSSLLYALFGLTFAIYGDNPLFRPYNAGLAKIFWGTSEIPVAVEPFRAFIWAPFGGTIACCYILLAYIARYPFLNKERWARNAILFAFGTWVIADSWACFRAGVYFQIYLINAFSILTKALPIVFTWKDFKEH
jgi:hypothetical protein